MKRYIVICILAFLAGCSSVPNEKQRSTFLKQEKFSKNYKLAVLAMWIQPPYQEATALLSEDALMRLEQRLADETGKELPASATPWNGVALHKPAPNRSSIYRRLEQDTPLIKAGGYDGILAVTIEPGVIPRNEMFRAGVKQKDCPPTSYARGPSCPYLVEERLGEKQRRRVNRDVRIAPFEAFIYMQSLSTGNLLIENTRLRVECDETARYQPVDSLSQVVDRCFDKISDEVLRRLDRILESRSATAR